MSQIYALLFSSGVVKVGRTTRGANRLRQHAQAAAKMGVSVQESFVVDAKDCVAAEKVALDSVRALCSSVQGNEWFFGADFAKVREALEQAATAERPKPPASFGKTIGPFPRRVRFNHTYPNTWECRACGTPVPSIAPFGDAFVCIGCAREGYTAGGNGPKEWALRLHGEKVPVRSRLPDDDWPMHERSGPIHWEITSGTPYPDWPHPDGRPCIDVARPTPAAEPVQAAA